MKTLLQVLKWSAIGGSFGLIIPLTAIYSCIYGDNALNNFFRNVAYATHAASPPKVIVASPNKLKPKKVELCFISDSGVKQCK
jgi:hypothetical protein